MFEVNNIESQFHLDLDFSVYLGSLKINFSMSVSNSSPLRHLFCDMLTYYELNYVNYKLRPDSTCKSNGKR
jgi:hypothetical protein